MRIKNVRQLPVELDGAMARKKAVVELDGKLKAGRYRSPYVLASYVDGLPGPHERECLLFLCEEDGGVLDWSELHGVYGLDYGESYAAMLEWLEKLEGISK